MIDWTVKLYSFRISDNVIVGRQLQFWVFKLTLFQAHTKTAKSWAYQITFMFSWSILWCSIRGISKYMTFVEVYLLIGNAGHFTLGLLLWHLVCSGYSLSLRHQYFFKRACTPLYFILKASGVYWTEPIYVSILSSSKGEILYWWSNFISLRISHSFLTFTIFYLLI